MSANSLPEPLLRNSRYSNGSCRSFTLPSRQDLPKQRFIPASTISLRSSSDNSRWTYCLVLCIGYTCSRKKGPNKVRVCLNMGYVLFHSFPHRLIFLQWLL